MSNITTVRRSLKNVAYNFSEAQVKVREATSNDPWGPSSSLMSEIADLTYNAMAFSDIMQMIWKRLNDHGKNWRHVYKSLVLLDYLIKTGSDKVAQQCKENIFAIQTLKDFQHIEENKDQGMNVREKAKQLVSLLKDDERLKNERARALMAKKRFAQNSMGISSDGSQTRLGRSRNSHTDDDVFNTSNNNIRTRRDSELEEARPTSSGEEELQLQIALALSKEEAAKEDDMRKGDHVRLQMALSESKEKYETEVGKAKTKERESVLDELFSLDPPSGGGGSTSSDPWGGAVGGSDPWAPAASTVSRPTDPWSAPTAAVNLPAKKDPWAPETNGGGGAFGFNGTGTEQQQNGASLSPPPPSYNAAMGGGEAWTFDPMGGSLDNSGGTNGAGAAVDRSATKTPETFLGENSSLVNLDNLMGPSKPVAPTSTNPFALSASGAGVPQTRVTPNPFLAQQRPSPTLNQMRLQNTAPAPNNSAGDWNLPAPLLPASAAAQPQQQQQGSFNPFL